jgi:hypothetical protein
LNQLERSVPIAGLKNRLLTTETSTLRDVQELFIPSATPIIKPKPRPSENVPHQQPAPQNPPLPSPTSLFRRLRKTRIQLNGLRSELGLVEKKSPTEQQRSIFQERALALAKVYFSEALDRGISRGPQSTKNVRLIEMNKEHIEKLQGVFLEYVSMASKSGKTMFREADYAKLWKLVLEKHRLGKFYLRLKTEKDVKEVSKNFLGSDTQKRSIEHREPGDVTQPRVEGVEKEHGSVFSRPVEREIGQPTRKHPLTTETMQSKITTAEEEVNSILSRPVRPKTQERPVDYQYESDAIQSKVEFVEIQKPRSQQSSYFTGSTYSQAHSSQSHTASPQSNLEPTISTIMKEAPRLSPREPPRMNVDVQLREVAKETLRKMEKLQKLKPRSTTGILTAWNRNMVESLAARPIVLRVTTTAANKRKFLERPDSEHIVGPFMTDEDPFCQMFNTMWLRLGLMNYIDSIQAAEKDYDYFVTFKSFEPAAALVSRPDEHYLGDRISGQIYVTWDEENPEERGTTAILILPRKTLDVWRREALHHNAPMSPYGYPQVEWTKSIWALLTRMRFSIGRYGDARRYRSVQESYHRVVMEVSFKDRKLMNLFLERKTEHYLTNPWKDRFFAKHHIRVG